MGVWNKQKITSKAKDDYKNRKEKLEKDTTFVFATFRVWEKKDDFCKECNYDDSKKCKEVLALNSVDYEEWLKEHPAIALWMAGQIDKLPRQNIKLVQTRLEEWEKQTQIELSSDLVLYNRESEQDNLLKLLNNKNGLINIVAPSELEGFIFALSVIKNNGYESRVLIVGSQDTWEQIVEQHNGLILLYDGFTPNNVGHASSKHIIIRISDCSNEVAEMLFTLQIKTRFCP